MNRAYKEKWFKHFCWTLCLSSLVSSAKRLVTLPTEPWAQPLVNLPVNSVLVFVECVLLTSQERILCLFYSVLPVSFLPSLSQWLLTCSNNILTSLKKRRKKYPNFCVYHLTKVLDVLRISSPLSLSFFFFLVTCIFESVFGT